MFVKGAGLSSLGGSCSTLCVHIEGAVLVGDRTLWGLGVCAVAGPETPCQTGAGTSPHSVPVYSAMQITCTYGQEGMETHTLAAHMYTSIHTHTHTCTNDAHVDTHIYTLVNARTYAKALHT